MATFGQIAKNIQKIDMNRIYTDVFSEPNIKKWITDTIKERLYNVGIDGKGNKLKTDKAQGGNFYADRTIAIKRKKGQKTSNVTLKDTGEFHNSMKVLLNLYGFETDANFMKSSSNIYRNFLNSYSTQQEFTGSIMSLSDTELTDLIKNKAMPEIKKRFNAAL